MTAVPLFGGTSIDPRCTQIGAFNLALAAWRRVGHCKLPAMNLACSGLAPNTREADWLVIAGDNQKLQRGMERLYRLFQKAAVLGSLINPRAGEDDLLVATFHELQPLLEKALAQETKDDTAHEMAVTARGLAKAAEILASQFTLVATNVPYLGRGKQDQVLMDYCERVHPESKADLATCFIERSFAFCGSGSSTALVTPQNWLSQLGYKSLRRAALQSKVWNYVVRLGPGAFQTISGEVVNVALFCASNQTPPHDLTFQGIDVSEKQGISTKCGELAVGSFLDVRQASQLGNPDARIAFSGPSNFPALEKWCTALMGSGAGDRFRFVRNFWEVLLETRGVWEFHQTTPSKTAPYAGREEVILWEKEKGQMCQFAESVKHLNHKAQQWRSGKPNWGKRGVAVSLMASLPASLYTGEIYATKCTAIVPFQTNESILLALWTFCSSDAFAIAVRETNPRLAIEVREVLQVPFDLAHWQKVAAEKYPHGLPKPFSSDPTQWLFNGHPAGADQPLHVAVARLLGYQWPRQTGSSFPDCPALDSDGLEKFADDDGIVCLPPLNREQPAANRLRELLAQALGQFDERALIASADSKGSKSTTLEDWLRDEFFEQHCTLFHKRPFLWHIWDGRKDGFAALVNYHQLDHANLQKLTYSYLGDWIHQQEADAKADKPGADARLGAAQVLQAELAKILEGEAPYDIFIRWKKLAAQAIGWNPDLNDGVRMNIRPFLIAKDVGKKGAGLFRAKPGTSLKWTKDRGKEPQRDKTEYPWFWCEEEPTTDPKPSKDFTGHRWNDVHLNLEQKAKAQK